jgi:hypothetical protein
MIKNCFLSTSLLVVPAALLLGQGQAKAGLVYNIFESAGNVVVQASGSLDLNNAIKVGGGGNGCGTSGAIAGSVGAICTGPDPGSFMYAITGPFSIGTTVDAFPASAVSGISTVLFASASLLFIDETYVFNTPITSSATFIGQTLASLGFAPSGSLGPWTIDGTSETILLNLAAPPSAASVPGPLPLVGACTAFALSRRLRQRLAVVG